MNLPRTKHLKKIELLLIFALVTIGFSVGESYGAGFMKFEGIDGESKDSNHDKWIDVLSVSFPSESQGTDTANIVQITKKLDSSSAQISQSTISGKIHPIVIFHDCPDTREQTECKEYNLLNVFFTKYSVSAAGDDRPVETISFVYEKIREKTKEPIPEEPKEIIPEEPKEMIPDDMMIQTRVPDWVQTTATFWVEGDVTDREFTDGIGFLVKEKIIELDEPVESETSDEPTDPQVPDWIKESTNWWIDGLVPEDQFLEGIKWLIKNNIIRGVSN